MPKFEKGKSKTGGRSRGTPNEVATDVKRALFEALDRLGGVDYLVKLGNKRPEVFAQLLGRVIPRQVEVDVNDADARIQALNEGRARARAAIEARNRRRKKALGEAAGPELP